MKPYFESPDITIFHGDCMAVLPILDQGSIDAVISDPPYGMKNDCDCSRFTTGPRSNHGARGWVGHRWPSPVTADDRPFDPTPWLTFPRVILFGYNHFAARLPVGTTLVWVKRREAQYGTFLSDAELAWMKGGHGVYCQQDTSQYSGTKYRKHPTQKPISLMRWCIEKAKVPSNGLILDPYMGSGTTLLAARALGRRAIGIEIEERYCEVAVKRLENGVQRMLVMT